MTEDSASIRPYEDGDFEGFRQAVGRVARERRFFTFLETPSVETIRAYAEGCRERGDPRFVAVAAGVVVGWCDVVQFSDREVFRHRGMLGMGLDSAWRGRGLGQRLLAAALAASWASGYRRVELLARADNGPAIALYRKFGFVDEGVMKAGFLVDGVYYDELRMALLAPSLAGEDLQSQ